MDLGRLNDYWSRQRSIPVDSDERRCVADYLGSGPTFLLVSVMTCLHLSLDEVVEDSFRFIVCNDPFISWTRFDSAISVEYLGS